MIGFAPPRLASTARSHAPDASSQSICSTESCSRAVLSCSQDFHMGMTVAAVARSRHVAVFIIEPGRQVDVIPRGLTLRCP
jgi:hypothetical protein